MNVQFKKRVWKLSRWFIGLFIILFVFRFFYGFTITTTEYNNNYREDFFGSINNIRKNYASEKFQSKGNVQVAPNIASSQKFEKTASIQSKSSNFESDEKKIKSKTKSYNAVIQYEQQLGQKGSREVHLLIGVNPNQFDSFYHAVLKIGVIKASEITKVDKTNEYRQLNAKKTSIENTLQSLKELKSKGGEIADFVSLNEKILEVEERLQELGVELGNFDTENEFCTIKLSVYEGAVAKSISIFSRIKTALEWTVKYFALIVLSILGVALASLVLIVIIDKIIILSNTNSRHLETKNNK